MKKIVTIDKQTKKAQKAYNALNRVSCSMNTGIRTMGDKKHPTRAQLKTREFKTQTLLLKSA